MNPVKKLKSWWKGPTDPEAIASEIETQRQLVHQQTIRISQNAAGKQVGSLLAAPTPDVLDPGGDHSHNSR
jgi:hypothetical protein